MEKDMHTYHIIFMLLKKCKIRGKVVFNRLLLSQNYIDKEKYCNGCLYFVNSERPERCKLFNVDLKSRKLCYEEYGRYLDGKFLFIYKPKV